MWEQFTDADAPLELPLYGGRIDPAPLASLQAPDTPAPGHASLPADPRHPIPVPRSLLMDTPRRA